ncbi:MAG: hypothetical protein KKD44_26240, partial [Proteobacteria bacterium]|nr:hypothetical protein [Pseudomonadota bacterium]
IGECNRCGWCCEHEDCEHYIPSKNGEKAICAIHDKDRPLKCVEFPAAPPILHEGCGYRFYDKWERKHLGAREV